MATVSKMSRLGCCLIWGLLADTGKPHHLLAAGLFILGIASILILFLRFFHGFGFASVYPVHQKIAASMKNKDESSLVFGILQGLSSLGRVFCAMVTTIIAQKVLLGYIGWRTSYVVLGYVWILLAIAILFGMEGKPINGSNGGQSVSSSNDSSQPQISSSERIAKVFGEVLTERTPKILIVTVFISESLMCALSYMSIYLQYTGVPKVMAGFAVSVTLIGAAVGAGLGGWIIKTIAESFDKYGILSCGTVVMVVRYVACLLFFLGPAPNGRLLWYHYVELVALGTSLLTIGAVDRTLVKNSIKSELQATASATIRTIAGICSSVILYQLSAYLSEKVFGYVPSRMSFEAMDAAVKERNANALRKSMMCIIAAGATINLVCYAALFFTYPSEKKIGEPKKEEEK
ncbi:major facilitator superfamily member protein [Babesia ovata]|uniref:Major facilitator superfamily member protein n=1 Tax=Babesia ovata TaxID=189622 RepID=A0A2H6KGE3_9APIC|nr:major facilitator superfamily member protein [Babesia ovata]GBE62054.1 major facilitator superfamily member protein [Babesia ovata]